MRFERLARWALPVHVAAIYSTLSVARVASNWLRERGLLRWTVGAAFFACAVGVLVLLLREPRFRTWRLAVGLLIVAALGAVVGWSSETPEERLHLVEYGALALLWDLALPASLSGWRRTAVALLATTLCGWGDELIQGLLPTRHYDVRDVVLNGASGAWALVGRFILDRTATGAVALYK